VPLSKHNDFKKNNNVLFLEEFKAYLNIGAKEYSIENNSFFMFSKIPAEKNWSSVWR
jgi:hypothetical protein